MSQQPETADLLEAMRTEISLLRQRKADLNDRLSAGHTVHRDATAAINHIALLGTMADSYERILREVTNDAR